MTETPSAGHVVDADHMPRLTDLNDDTSPYPALIGIYCDNCGAEHCADYLVPADSTYEQRFETARTHLRTRGWSCADGADHCPDCANTTPETNGTTAMADSPVSLAADAKRDRDLGAEIGILTGADTDLKTQPWLPLRDGDVVLMALEPVPDLADMSETYIAEFDGSAEGASLRLISTNFPIPDGAPLMPFYDLWMEAGSDAITVIRAGVVVFGNPLRSA